MKFILIVLYLSMSSFSNGAELVSTFSATLGNPSIPIKIQITWGEEEIKKISVSDLKGKLIQYLNISGDWTNLGNTSDHDRKDIILSVDANFDGQNDLLIESSHGTAGQLFKLFKFEPKTKKFESSNALDEIWNPSFDEKLKIVKAGAKDMKQITYIWKGETLKVKK